MIVESGKKYSFRFFVYYCKKVFVDRQFCSLIFIVLTNKYAFSIGLGYEIVTRT